jgi:hypothetical protein
VVNHFCNKYGKNIVLKQIHQILCLRALNLLSSLISFLDSSRGTTYVKGALLHFMETLDIHYFHEYQILKESKDGFAL